jgi:acyl-CoA reductase-like NAD-dependent aldehyde dehydrogenase
MERYDCQCLRQHQPLETIVEAYGGLKIGNPLDETNHVGPLIDQHAVKQFLSALEKVQEEGGKTQPLAQGIKFNI